MRELRARQTLLCGNTMKLFDAFGALLLLKQGESSLAKMSFGKVLGLIFGCVVVAVLIFMMFVILGNLMHGEQ
jgi:hypothetical protein